MPEQEQKQEQEQEQESDGTSSIATAASSTTALAAAAESPPARIRKVDVKEMLRLMDNSGLVCTIYAVQKRGGTLVGKPAVLKKKADANMPGGGRIDCEVRTPAVSTNGFTGVFGSTPMKARSAGADADTDTSGIADAVSTAAAASADIIAENHPAAATIKVLRFAISDVLQVRRGRCGLMQLPPAVGDSACLVVTVRNKGELNFVMESKHRCEVAYVAFHYLMQRCRASPDNTPSPVPSARARAPASTAASVVALSPLPSPGRCVHMYVCVCVCVLCVSLSVSLTPLLTPSPPSSLQELWHID